MAIMTTSKTLGWYGSHDSEECSPLSLPDTFGTYNSSGVFQPGSSGLSESQASKIEVWSAFTEIGTWSWSLSFEKTFRNTAPSVLAQLDKLECGRMYWITYKGVGKLNIPGYVPTAMGVDMGRISA
tara:strand:+ start:2074 stop:2451 length:378 start_codon:yes stop_codon:yes gene_type:complete